MITKKNNKNLTIGRWELNHNRIIKIFIAGFITCLILRIVSNSILGVQQSRNITMTHLRFDSLLAGVFISYYYHAKKITLTQFYISKKTLLQITPFIFLAYTPFIESNNSYFVKTIGFTLNYIAFGVILLHVLLDPKIDHRLDNFYSRAVVNSIAKIGFWSYGIYVIHTLIIKIVEKIGFQNLYINFLLVIVGSIVMGGVITEYVERYFLKIRDSFFPSHTFLTIPIGEALVQTSQGLEKKFVSEDNTANNN